MKSWLKYKNTAFFQGTAVTNNMTDEDAKACDNIRTKAVSYTHLEADAEALKGTVKELPSREVIDVPVDEMLIVELYSK